MPYDSLSDDEVRLQLLIEPAPTGRERLVQLRDFLKTLPPEKFNMNYWHEDAKELFEEEHRHPTHCGTVACIGGWAQELFGMDPNIHTSTYIYSYLGLGHPLEGGDLFYPDIDSDLWEHITLAHAITVLDTALDTGVVDWSLVEEELEELAGT